MNRILLLLSALLIANGLFAQQMVIEDFHLDIRDQTANNEDSKVIDDNGNPCALLKIETSEKGFTFEGGTIGIARVDESQTGEIWVYVPASLRRITIKHPQLGILRDYAFENETLQPARVYVMRLVSGEVDIHIKHRSTSQFFVLTFEPAEAMVEIDGTIVETSDGTYSGMLSHGRHEFRISKNNYHTEAGYVEIGTEKVEKRVVLNPAFGWIEIKGPSGASVYIDNSKVGVVPMKSEPVASGSHDVRVVKDKYLPYREQVLVNDNTVVVVTPVLTANFVTVNLTVAGNAEIWVNGEKKGSGSVSVDLVPGDYTLETRKASHRSQSIVRNITMASGGTIELPAPVAITGTLMVNVMPVGATITVDGKNVGTSPMLIENVLIGGHEVVISKAGCAERRESVQIADGQTYSMEGKLAQGQDVRLSCGVPTARWTVDGVERGKGSEIIVKLSYSEHSVVIKAEEYVDFEEKFTVGTNTTSMSFSLKKKILVESIIVNGVSFNMRRVDGGTFIMGNRYITLSDYYIGETQVTQALWKAVMGNNPSKFIGDNLPVEQVSWIDCQEFIKRLNNSTGRKFSLPTDAQWIFAALGGNKSLGYKYPGSDDIDSVAWYYANSSNQTHPVAKKKANELGIYDMCGNVWEWCLDWYGNYNNYSETDPTGPLTGSYRISHGGSCYEFANTIGIEPRGIESPDSRGSQNGLRLVMLP